MQIGDGFVGELVETAGGNIFLELPVPSRAVKFCEPRAQASQLLGRQLLDRPLDLKCRAHVDILAGRLAESMRGTRRRRRCASRCAALRAAIRRGAKVVATDGADALPRLSVRSNPN